MKSCPKCFLNHEDDVLVCDCGYALSSQAVKKSSPVNWAAQSSQSSSLVSKYGSLRTISSYFNLLAWLNLIVSIVVAVFMLKNVAIFPCLGFIVWGFSVFIINAAASELIMVAIDIEEHLRKIAFLQEKQVGKL